MTTRLRAHPTAFGRSLEAQRRARDETLLAFAVSCDVTINALKQWMYGRRGISSSRASKLARRLGLPPWHFEHALAQDRIAAICRVNEVTAVVVGLAEYVERVLPGAEWAAARAKILEGM